MAAPAIPPSVLTATGIANTGGALTSYRHEVPVDLGWNQDLLPLNLRSDWQASGLRTGSCGLTAKQAFARFSTAFDTPQRTFYVRMTGNDASDGLTWGTAVRSIWRAVQLRNAYPTETAKIFVDGATGGGYYPRAFSFSQSGTPFMPLHDTAFVATGGRVRTGTLDVNSTFAVDATYANTYSAARSSVDRVLDMTRPLPMGGYFELRNVTTAAICNVRPDTWALVSGTLYVNRGDGAQPVVSGATPNSMVTISGALTSYTGTPVNLLFCGENTGDGFDLYGGSGGAPANFTYSTRPAVPKTHVFESCTFNYGGGPTSGYVSRGVSIDNLDGLAAIFNCSARGNASDSFNLHHSLVNGGQLYAYTENCSAYDHGRGNAQSCNALTIHENVIGVDLCGRYFHGKGGTVRNINTSKQLLAATHVEGDTGDRSVGGAVDPTAIRIDDTAQIWTDLVSVNMPSGSIGYYATTSSVMRMRRTIPSTGGRTGAGTYTVW